MMKGRFYLVAILAILFLGFVQCKKEEVEPGDTFEEMARDQFYQLMQDWYLWYKEMPDVDVENYASAYELLEALRYLPVDVWSYITTKEEWDAFYEQGAYAGHGFGYTYDGNGKAWIIFVFRDSDMYPEGVERGWQILKINGSTIEPFTNITTYMNGTDAGTVDVFEFRRPDGSTVNVTSTRKEIVMNTVLHADTLHVGGEIVGHMVFKSFIEPSIEELDSVFSAFKAHGVTRLIVDLRYNGGGRVDVAVKLASLISGSDQAGNVFIKYTHNDKQSATYDQSVYFDNESNALDISEVIIFTTRSTASASEIIINGLKPYMDVVTIGDNTYGKPVGMYAWTYAEELVFVPVSFRTVNANDEGDYYNGLSPDSFVQDGYEYAFYDRNENYLKEAIYYISTSSFTGGTAGLKSWYLPALEKKGLQFEIGAE
jgi:C-terminal processing protease CtpA/Prc